MMNQYIADELFKNNIQVTKQQWIILKILHEKNDEVIQNDLAFITNRNKASLTRLISLMEKNKIKRLPVVSDNIVLGIVTMSDLID